MRFHQCLHALSNCPSASPRAPAPTRQRRGCGVTGRTARPRARRYDLLPFCYMSFYVADRKFYGADVAAGLYHPSAYHAAQTLAGARRRWPGARARGRPMRLLECLAARARKQRERCNTQAFEISIRQTARKSCIHHARSPALVDGACAQSACWRDSSTVHASKRAVQQSDDRVQARRSWRAVCLLDK